MYRKRDWVTRRALKLLGQGCAMGKCRSIATKEWAAGIRDINFVVPDMMTLRDAVFAQKLAQVEETR